MANVEETEPQLPLEVDTPEDMSIVGEGEAPVQGRHACGHGVVAPVDQEDDPDIGLRADWATPEHKARTL